MAEIFLVNFNPYYLTYSLILPLLLKISGCSGCSLSLSLSAVVPPHPPSLSRIRCREFCLPPPSRALPSSAVVARDLSLSSIVAHEPPSTGDDSASLRRRRWRGVVRFRLDECYSELDKKLCMIGKSNFEPSVVLKLNYLKWSSIYDSLISGSLESVVSDKDDGENSFDAIMVLAFSVKHSYGYTFVGEDRMSSFLSSVESGESIGLSNLNDSNGGLCRLLGNRLKRFELVLTLPLSAVALSLCRRRSRCLPPPATTSMN
ncbi:hypothetical protein ACLB2K_059557 [Fragaria x ananassa]